MEDQSDKEKEIVDESFRNEPTTTMNMTEPSHREVKAKDELFNTTIMGDENFQGPVGNRNCTDFFWLIIFITANIVFVSAAIFIFMEGDIERVLHGADFRGELCGIDDLSDKEYLFWPAPD